MKKVLFVSILFIFAARLCIYAQDADKNYINYYAVNNSIDGQIMIDKMNLLRFFPVFTLYENVTDVEVTIYYGTEIYNRKADKYSDGKYWQVLLPDFKLGGAIQKIEVETKFKLGEAYHLAYQKEAKLLREELEKNTVSRLNQFVDCITTVMNPEKDYGLYDLITKTENDISKLSPDSIKQMDKVEELYKSIKSTLEKFENDTLHRMEDYLTGPLDIRKNSNFYLPFTDTNSRIDSLKNIMTLSGSLKFRKYLNFYSSLTNTNSLIDSLKNIITKIDVLENDYPEKNKNIKKIYEQWHVDLKKVGDQLNFIQAQTDSITKYIGKLDTLIVFEVKAREDIKNKILSELSGKFTDSLYSGQSVRPSDIIIDDSFEYARILYRNYKYNLRRMQALDPQERMGIFRVRYVPFPVTVTHLKEDGKLYLVPLSGDGAQTVFEIGLAFGDAVVPGDDFVSPQFSFQRMGVALALTQKLFDKDAEIKAIALTYDFNSYGSIGAGGNFAHNIIRPYFSFGINKKAFEALLKGLASLFQ